MVCQSASMVRAAAVLSRAVGRQIPELGAHDLDGLAHTLHLVGAEVVHDRDVAGPQDWRQRLLYMGQEARR